MDWSLDGFTEKTKIKAGKEAYQHSPESVQFGFNTFITSWIKGCLVHLDMFTALKNEHNISIEPQGC